MITVATHQSRTIAVVIVPGAVLMPWANVTAAIVMQVMPGQEAGNALAQVLFGEVNPSGRLPLTMPNIENEMQFTQSQYPGVPKVLRSHRPFNCAHSPSRHSVRNPS